MNQTKEKEKLEFEEERKQKERVIQYRPINIPNKIKEADKKEKDTKKKEIENFIEMDR